MKHTATLVAVLCLLAAFSCTSEENGVDDRSIRFDVNVTKATDTSFEEGDEISLFASDPINATNVKLTVAGSSAIPETDLFWGEGQTEATVFDAVYPFSVSHTSSEVTFETAADQSVEANHKSSDLMTASTSQTPGHKVALSFSHKLAKLRLNITNNTDYTVTGVSAGILKNRYNCATGQASGSATIKAFCISQDVWALIAAPQSVSGVITVSTTGGDFTFSGDFLLPAGKESSCSITLSEHIPPIGEEAQFSCSVNDWDPGVEITCTETF